MIAFEPAKIARLVQAGFQTACVWAGSVASGVLASASDAVPGLPPALDLTSTPTAWIELANDAWGPQQIDNRDDGRTASLRTGSGFKRWRLALDASMLTSKRLGLRSDELTATLGYALHETTESAVVVVAGTRLAGELGGAGIQRWWHEAVGYTYDTLTYAPTGIDVQPVAGIALHRDVRWSSLRIRGMLQGLVSGHGEIQGLGGIHLLAVVPGAWCWLGPEWRIRAGAPVGPVAADIAEHERGLWLASGLQIGILTTSAGASANGEDVQGSVGLASATARHAGPGSWQVALELGATLTAPGLIQRLRLAYLAYPIEFRCDTRAGSVPGQIYAHDSVRYRQVSIGPGWAPRLTAGNFGIGPDVEGGIGWRVEGIVGEDGSPELPPLRQHGAVLTMGAGLGIDYAIEPSLSVGAACSWDVAQPLVRPLLVGPATMLDLSTGWSLKIGSAVQW